MNIKEFFATLGIELDAADFQAADEALASVQEGIEWVASTALAGAAALGAMVLSTANEASEISKLATLMGVSTSVAQEWAYAAAQSGLSADDLGQMVAELAENLGEAAGGTGEAADAFKSLGLSLKDSNGNLKETPVALNEIADKLSQMADGQKKTAAITGLFGEEGIKLLPILNQGSAGLARYAEEARSMGLIIDTETIESGKQLKANLNTLSSTLTALAAQIAGPFISELNELFKSLREWWKLNGRIVGQRLEKVFAVLIALLKPLVKIVLLFGKALGFLIDNLETVLVILGSLLVAAFMMQLRWHLILIGSWLRLGASAFWAGLQAVAAWVAAAAPLLAVAALIALLVLLFEDFYVWMQGGDSLMGALWEKYKGFIKEWLEPKDSDNWLLAGIKAVLRALIKVGEYFPILMEDIKELWTVTVSWMSDLFAAVFDDIVAGANAVLDMLPGGEARKLGRISSVAQQAIANKGMSDAIARGEDPFTLFANGWRSMMSGQAMASVSNTAKTLTDNRTMNVNVAGLDSKEAAEKFIGDVGAWFGGVLSDAKGAK